MATLRQLHSFNVFAWPLTAVIFTDLVDFHTLRDFDPWSYLSVEKIIIVSGISSRQLP